MKKIFKLLTPILGLTSITSGLFISSCACNKGEDKPVVVDHITYKGPKSFEIEAFGQLDIECELDKEFDKETDSIELICSIDNFFECSTTVDGKKLTIHLSNNELLSLEYDKEINLEIKIKTKDWTDSIKDLVFNYCVEREKSVKAYCFRNSKVVITIGYGIDLQYSLDGNEWIPILYDQTIEVEAGKSIYFKGNNPKGLINTNIQFLEQNTDFMPSVFLLGNILGLLDDGLGTYDDTLPKSCFYNLFWASKGLYGVSPRFLRSTKLSQLCYANMFKDNYNFEYAPQLPADELAPYCYWGMFQSCNNLKTPPQLPATKLAEHCYDSMFNTCLSLEYCPELNATELAKYCYSNMFYKCRSLISTCPLPANTLADYCYYAMFQDCPNIYLVSNIEAKVLAKWCCNSMFINCSNLKVIESSSESAFFTCPDYDETKILNPVKDMFSDTKEHAGTFTPQKNKSYSYQ